MTRGFSKNFQIVTGILTIGTFRDALLFTRETSDRGTTADREAVNWLKARCSCRLLLSLIPRVHARRRGLRRARIKSREPATSRRLPTVRRSVSFSTSSVSLELASWESIHELLPLSLALLSPTLLLRTLCFSSFRTLVKRGITNTSLENHLSFFSLKRRL